MFQFIELEAPFSLKEMLGQNITLIPTVQMKNTFGKPVRYVPDVIKAIKGLTKANNPDELTLFGEGNEIAFFKSNAWAFQQEYRFVLIASPGPATPFLGDPLAYIESRRAWQRSGINLLTDIPNCLHIDLELDHNALMCAEILVGPLAPPGTIEIVESLVARFAAGATVRLSSLSGAIRPK
ncbi:MAG: hypothetical protein V7772_04655 [Pseudomonas profundi]|uniref:hypothetical protein n=1 Tax=Pseudomonas profundi TaxID=1981513 RepID=UPI0030012786